jgi:hypothetical protein
VAGEGWEDKVPKQDFISSRFVLWNFASKLKAELFLDEKTFDVL